MSLTDGKPLRDCWQEVAEKLVYTGAIDEYFGYRELAAREQNVIFGGRLAEYKYYDMAPIVEKVLGMEV